MKELQKELSTILTKAYNEGFNNGILAGISAVERVRVWFVVNRELKNPKEIEELNTWAINEVTKLKEMFKY